MKVIDLLNKIANDEEVPIFKYEKHRYKYNKENKYFEDLDNDEYCKPDVFLVELNDEIEIIDDAPKEDNKIEKIKDYRIFKTMGLDCEYHERKEPKNYSLEEKEIVDKINEIIDKINGEK